MSLKDLKNVKSSGSSNIPTLEPGTYPGRFYQAIELGLQKQHPYKGQEKQPRDEVLLAYEFSDEFLLDEDGNEDTTKPRVLSERVGIVGLDNDRAKLTKRYSALDPDDKQDGNLLALIGTPCMITVVNNENKGKTYNNVGAITPMREKDAKKLPDLVNPPRIFSLDDPDVEEFNSIPEWIQKIIKDAEDFKGSKLDVLLRNSKEDSVEAEEEKEDQTTDEVESDDGEEW